MKKLLCIFLFFISFNLYSQIDMYDGIKSGIGLDDFNPKWYKTEINNNIYYISPYFKNDKLSSLILFSKRGYKIVGQTKKDIDKLVLILYDTYGFPMLVDDRSTETFRNIFIFQKNSLLVDLSVLIKDDKYYIFVTIIDRKFVKDNYY